ncbi:MAG: glutathione S-transferase N-terminal domain-containing protein, partial [Myxococcota bacterium]
CCSEIVALLLSLAQEHAARGGETPWPRYYAELTVERYVAAQAEGLSLYHFQSCPFCRMVTRTIDELGISVELRDVMAEPKWRAELIAARGRATVPVLRCVSPNGAVRWMPESRDIIKYLRDRHS